MRVRGRFIDQFFADDQLMMKYADDAMSRYTPEELDKLNAEIDRRDSWEAEVNWSEKKNREYQQLKQKKTRITALLNKLADEAREAEKNHDEQAIESIGQDIAELQLSLKLVKDNIEDYAYEKAKYLKSISKNKTDREKQIDRDRAISGLGMDKAEAAGLSDEELNDLFNDAIATNKKEEKKRRRAIKRGDVSDELEARKKAAQKTANTAIKNFNFDDFM